MSDFELHRWHTLRMDSAALPMLDGLDVEALKALLAEQHAQYRAALNSNAQQIEHLNADD